MQFKPITPNKGAISRRSLNLPTGEATGVSKFNEKGRLETASYSGKTQYGSVSEI
ncbi:hypothetical protein JYQ62_32715 [Nostoc sp. UHCC 0702]|nr:hypothetical protein JYQ62_32715 [Nostoc sp. UHCC 0702]